MTSSCVKVSKQATNGHYKIYYLGAIEIASLLGTEEKPHISCDQDSVILTWIRNIDLMFDILIATSPYNWFEPSISDSNQSYYSSLYSFIFGRESMERNVPLLTLMLMQTDWINVQGATDVTLTTSVLDDTNQPRQSYPSMYTSWYHSSNWNEDCRRHFQILWWIFVIKRAIIDRPS